MQNEAIPSLLTGRRTALAKADKVASAEGQPEPNHVDTRDDHAEHPETQKTDESKNAAGLGIVEAANHFAVAQLGEDILLAFRRKSLALILVQSICVNAIAFGVDSFARRYHWHWMNCVGTWLFSVSVLFILNYVRHKVPLNYILIMMFSISTGIASGLLHAPMQEYTLNWAQQRGMSEASASNSTFFNSTGASSTFNSLREANSTSASQAGASLEGLEAWTHDWPLQCYGMTAHTIALALLVLMTCFKHPGKGLVKILPVSVVVAILTDIAVLAAFVFHRDHIPPLFAIMAILLNSLSLIWIGYQMDSLSLRLKVEEWVYPLILLWCEVISLGAVAVVLLALCSAGDDASACGGGAFACDGGHGFYCDCYYGGAQSEQERSSDEPAPAQETMLVDV